MNGSDLSNLWITSLRLGPPTFAGRRLRRVTMDGGFRDVGFSDLTGPFSVTPHWTDGITIIPATALSFGNLVSGSIDLHDKYGAMIFVRLGRMGASGPNTPINITAHRVSGMGSGGASVSLYTGNAAGIVTNVNVDSASGQEALHVASTLMFSHGDIIVIYDAAFTRLEFARISRVASPDLLLDSPLGFTHTAAQADSVSKIADCYVPFWIAGGSVWDLTVDYGAATSGSDYVVQILAQTYDWDEVS